MSRIDAVVFDLDGVIVDSEQVWDEVRERFVRESGGTYTEAATRAMMGMSSPEWSRYLHEVVGLREPPEVIRDEVVRRMLARYETDLPVVPGAVEAVRRLAGDGYRLAVASSSNRELIDAVLDRLELTSAFEVTVSSEEVARGKPAPDVYLDVVRRLDQVPSDCAAVEDSTNGIRSALAAGLHVVVVPNRSYPPSAEVLAEAEVVLEDLDELTVEVFERLGS